MEGDRLPLQVKERHWLTVLSDLDTQQEQDGSRGQLAPYLHSVPPPLLVSSKNYPWLGLCLIFFFFLKIKMERKGWQ